MPSCDLAFLGGILCDSSRGSFQCLWRFSDTVCVKCFFSECGCSMVRFVRGSVFENILHQSYFKVSRLSNALIRICEGFAVINTSAISQPICPFRKVDAKIQEGRFGFMIAFE